MQLRDKPAEDAPAPLLILDDVTMRIRDRKLLPHTSWTIRRGEQWAVLGPNGSGKSTLARTISGELPSAGGHTRLADGERIALVSFEAQAALYGREVSLDEARRFAGREDDVLTPRHLFTGHGGETRTAAEVAAQEAGAAVGGRPADAASAADGVGAAAEMLGIDHLLDRPFLHLSAGEMRKTLIARALLQNPTLLVLDEPFDGLDARARDTVSRYLEHLMSSRMHIILVTHRAEEILAGVTHVLMIRDGSVVGAGLRNEMLD